MYFTITHTDMHTHTYTHMKVKKILTHSKMILFNSYISSQHCLVNQSFMQNIRLDTLMGI
jgi:hypothetical protein